jgi:hypothetical protein
MSITLFCCKNKTQAVYDVNDRILAKIEDKTLRLSDIAALIPENSESQDSAQIIRAFSENWAKEMVVLLSAEKAVSNDLNLGRLIKNYRESLLINNFEQKYIDKNLDTLITQEQLDSFYQQHKGHFISQEPLIKYWFAKISADKPGLDKFFERWKKADKKYIQKYCKTKAEIFTLNQDNWISASEFSQQIPQKLVSKINFEKEGVFQSNHDDFEYFLDIRSVIKKGEHEPQEFIIHKLTKLILHKRKTEMLDNLRSVLYDKALEDNLVKFY